MDKPCGTASQDSEKTPPICTITSLVWSATIPEAIPPQLRVTFAQAGGALTESTTGPGAGSAAGRSEAGKCASGGGQTNTANRPADGEGCGARQASAGIPGWSSGVAEKRMAEVIERLLTAGNGIGSACIGLFGPGV